MIYTCQFPRFHISYDFWPPTFRLSPASYNANTRTHNIMFTAIRTPKCGQPPPPCFDHYLVVFGMSRTYSCFKVAEVDFAAAHNNHIQEISQATKKAPRIRYTTTAIGCRSYFTFVQRASSSSSHCALITCSGRSFTSAIPRQAHHYARYTPSTPQLTQTFRSTASSHVFKICWAVDKDIDCVTPKDVSGVGTILALLKEGTMTGLANGTADGMEEGEEPTFTLAEEIKRQIRHEEW